MPEINVNRDSKLIKVLAAQAKHQNVDSNVAQEANEIVREITTDLNPAKLHQLAQVVSYGVDELQQHELDFLNTIADVKNIGYGDKAAFTVNTGTVKAYIQAKGATTARSMVASKQVLVDTKEISARPAINIVDLRAGRVNMAELIRQANREMTNKKMKIIQGVLNDSIDNFSSPFYGTGTGIVQATLDAQIAYFARLGNVTLVGDYAAVQQLAPLAGMQMNAGTSTDAFRAYSNNMIDEMNDNGFLGMYKGCNVMKMANAYEPNSTTPVLATNWLYIVPAGMSGDMKNLKVVNEGGVNSIEAQNIDDMVYEIRLDQWFGAAFCNGVNPNLGAYKIA